MVSINKPISEDPNEDDDLSMNGRDSSLND